MTPRQANRPRLVITNRQRRVRLDQPKIRALVAASLGACLDQPGREEKPVLPELDEVTVAILPPAEMARVHREFLGIEGPTDVITFPYGEILVCAEVAREYAEGHGTSVDDELALYIIHGLLHLNGFDDLSPKAARTMRARQAKILKDARKTV